MAAGGTWSAQNKKRPGAYINFISVPRTSTVLGTRGVIACALPMTWGPANEVISLTGTEFITGQSLAKVGCDASDLTASLPFRLALHNCNEALIYRSDTGGSKATRVLEAGSLTANAKYAGSTGNDISIVILEDTPAIGKYTVEILFKSIRRESHVVSVLADFDEIESKWVDFVVAASPVTSTIPVTSGMALAGGTNGTVSSGVYQSFFAAIEGRNWNCLAVNSTDAGVAPEIVQFITMLREVRGKKVQAVVYNHAAADYEGIINVDQGFKTHTETVGVDLFPIYVASLTAGSAVNESNTSAVVQNAVTIINPIDEEDIDTALDTGKFILTYRQDGAVCVEKDINSLHTFTFDKNYAFSKNRVIRCLDEIANVVALVFNRNYSGKVDNDSIGRNLFKTELISIMDGLAAAGAIQNFEGASDITVLPGADIESVVVDVTIQPVDSMEKLYMTVSVDA